MKKEDGLKSTALKFAMLAKKSSKQLGVRKPLKPVK
ncbi:hypothetical protein SAMN06272722_110118 [Paenibacillus sp. RU5A]|nr:hypothetical protein SAMN06272722_110118 [Paenibacillus sp. RU5A]SOC74292.1 hypothetical protein SAMN05880581_110118 [Paenibacillus sp. RU26A]SOC76441.1 hypothetical protein SAMN05880586_110118 [Paenibacillus sp. RU5M]